MQLWWIMDHIWASGTIADVVNGLSTKSKPKPLDERSRIDQYAERYFDTNHYHVMSSWLDHAGWFVVGGNEGFTFPRRNVT